MILNYLEFDYCEDEQGVGTFEAMASVSPQQVAQVLAEVSAVLVWAFQAYPDGHGPVDDGYVWDHDLQGQREYTAAESLCFDERTGRISVQVHEAGTPRHTVTLSVSGQLHFCEAMREQFSLG